MFGNSEERKRDRGVLNGIVHPAVRKEMYRQLLKCYLRGHWAVVLDVPLLFESGLDSICGVVMVVGVSDPEVQMRRLRERDPHLTEEDARNRVLSQGDVKAKMKRAEFMAESGGRGVVVLNDGTKEELKNNLGAVMAKLGRGSPRWWAWLLLLCPPLAGWIGVWNYWRGVTVSNRWKEKEVKERARL